MANVLVNDTSLADIADAIREKNGTAETYKPAEMGAAIREIESGGGDIDTLGMHLLRQLKTYTNENVTTLWDYSFFGNENIESIYLPNATQIRNSAFQNCYALKKIDFPKATVIRNSAFQNCKGVTKVNLPNANNLYDACFNGCKSVPMYDFSKITSIPTNCFVENMSLKTIVLRNETLVNLQNISAFNLCCHYRGEVDSTYNPTGAKDGYIYVPKALIETYKAATNWVTFANQFRALEDFTIDGTITGALDESKIAA